MYRRARTPCLLPILVATALGLAACGDDGGTDTGAGAGDDPTTTEGTDPTEPTEGTDGGAGSGGEDGTMCDVITDEQVSEALGVELSSEDGLFNNAEGCTYEDEDGGYRLFVGSIFGQDQPVSFFLDTGEANSDEFEELDGPGEAAYFALLSEDRALAASLGEDGQVRSVDLSVPDGEDPDDHRDALLELLQALFDATT